MFSLILFDRRTSTIYNIYIISILHTYTESMEKQHKRKPAHSATSTHTHTTSFHSVWHNMYLAACLQYWLHGIPILYLFWKICFFWWSVGVNTPFSPLSQKEFSKRKGSPFCSLVRRKRLNFKRYVKKIESARLIFWQSSVFHFHPDTKLLFKMFLLCFFWLPDKNWIYKPD